MAWGVQDFHLVNDRDRSGKLTADGEWRANNHFSCHPNRHVRFETISDLK